MITVNFYFIVKFDSFLELHFCLAHGKGDKIGLPLTDWKFTLSDSMDSFLWLLKQAYLSDIFGLLNMINLSLQGLNKNVFKIKTKLNGLLKVSNCGITAPFPREIITSKHFPSGDIFLILT